MKGRVAKRKKSRISAIGDETVGTVVPCYLQLRLIGGNVAIVSKIVTGIKKWCPERAFAKNDLESTFVHHTE